MSRPWTVVWVTEELSIGVEHVTAASAREALAQCPAAQEHFEEFGGDDVMVVEGHVHDALEGNENEDRLREFLTLPEEEKP